MNGIEVHGYAIVSRDDRIADASGVMPASLRNEADWAYFQTELDLADWVVLGRVSHEATPNVKRRRRLIVSQSARGLQQRDDGWWWRPDALGFGEVCAQLLPTGGRLAVPGGQGVFDLFLGIGYAAFHLARAETVELPGGRAIFGGGPSADAALRGAGLEPRRATWLDEAARVTLTVFARP